MTHDITLYEYEHEGALEHLIVDVMKDVETMKDKVGAELGADWHLLDIQHVAAGWELILRNQQLNMFIGRYRFLLIPRVTTISLALTHDLVTIDAVIAGYVAEDTAALRNALAAGMRTPLSKRRGFRFGADYRRDALIETVHEDVSELAEALSDQGVKVQALTADFETLSVLTDTDSWIFFPFDFYPFLGEYLLRITDGQGPDYILEPLNNIIEEIWGIL